MCLNSILTKTHKSYVGEKYFGFLQWHCLVSVLNVSSGCHGENVLGAGQRGSRDTSEKNTEVIQARGNGLDATRTQGQAKVSPSSGSIPTRWLLLPGLPLPQPLQYICFVSIILNLFLLLTTRSSNLQSLATLTFDLYSGLLEYRVWVWFIPPSRTLAQSPAQGLCSGDA